MGMGAGMSRFVIFSAALHLGTLAALGPSTARPPFFPATLNVTLDEPSGVKTESTRRMHTPSPPADVASVPGKAITQHTNSLSAPPANLRPATSSDDLTPANHGTMATDQMTRDNPSPQASERAEDLAEGKAPARPLEGESTQVVAPSAATMQAQKSDTNMLASQLESQLRYALAPYFSYPQMARRNGWQGRVRVGVRVEADGRLSHVHIAQSSGYRLLDSAALATLNHISTVPEAVGWLEGRHFDMVLPIDYRLIDGQS